MQDFPSNSINPQQPTPKVGPRPTPQPEPELSEEQGPERDRPEPVVTGEVKRRKTPLGKKFKNALFTTDSGISLTDYALFEVLIPSARKLFVDAMWQVVDGFGQGIQQKITGATGPVPTRRSSGTVIRPSNHVSYNGFSRPTVRPNPAVRQDPRPAMSRVARARHDFDELEFETRQEATLVLEEMYERLERFGNVSVADYYELCNQRGDHTDEVWGWKSLAGAGVVPTRGGMYVIGLPRTQPLN